MATETGADEPTSQNQPTSVAKDPKTGQFVAKRDPVLSARDQLLEQMDAQIAERRVEDDQEYLRSADPRAAAIYAEMGRESRGEPVSVDSTDAAAGQEAQPITQDVEGAEAAAARQVQVDNTGADPLAEYVVREGGKPMFKTLVDGQVKLIPLETARVQLQKHLAADIRLDQATQRRKELDARERQLNATAAQLATRTAQPVVPVDDAALEKESVELVRSLVNEPEAVAAKKLATTLTKIRAATPQIDVNAVARQAATVARQEIAAEDKAKALNSGFDEFTKSYPDIAADSDLFALADRKTNAIASEHPDWSPGQVMMEAGKQTRNWVAGISGKPVSTVASLSTRQQVKQTLKPMPQSRAARPAPAQDANEGTSPQDVMADIRKARGQDY